MFGEVRRSFRMSPRRNTSKALSHAVHSSAPDLRLERWAASTRALIGRS